jgi:hypothetical protein
MAPPRHERTFVVILTVTVMGVRDGGIRAADSNTRVDNGGLL